VKIDEKKRSSSDLLLGYNVWIDDFGYTFIVPLFTRFSSIFMQDSGHKPAAALKGVQHEMQKIFDNRFFRSGKFGHPVTGCQCNGGKEAQ
jgi:hypothetical protein